MKFLIILPILLSLILIPAISDVFAATYKIKIPSGAASPDAPYFWSNEKDGSTTGNISIAVGDIVEWGNADTAAHTVTSGTPDSGPSGLFDSSLFAPGKTFSYQFSEKGDFPYYCIVHPWMKGVVTVTAGLKVVSNVGANAGDGKTTFDVQYQYDRLISSAKIDQESKAITFTMVGKAIEGANSVMLMLPDKLIKGPYVIFVDGAEITEFKESKNGGITTLTIPVGPKAEQLTILGSAVVPEFGTIAMLVLGVALVSLVVVRSKLPITRLSKF